MVSPISALLLAQAIAAAGPGTYTNEEDRYFAQEAKRADIPPWQGVEIGADGRSRKVDAFGAALSDWAPGLPAGVTPSGADRLAFAYGGGRTSELRHAQQFTCWISARRDKDKPDGSPDWTYQPGLKLHNQGGRVMAGGNGAPQFHVRLRAVVWPQPTKRSPNLVLYVHKDDPDRAVSYAWADAGAKMVGINLRWMQGSCTRQDSAP